MKLTHCLVGMTLLLLSVGCDLLTPAPADEVLPAAPAEEQAEEQAEEPYVLFVTSEKGEYKLTAESGADEATKAIALAALSDPTEMDILLATSSASSIDDLIGHDASNNVICRHGDPQSNSEIRGSAGDGGYACFKASGKRAEFPTDIGSCPSTFDCTDTAGSWNSKILESPVILRIVGPSGTMVTKTIDRVYIKESNPGCKIHDVDAFTCTPN